MRVAAVVLAAGLALSFAGGPWADESISDLHVYRAYAEAFTGGELPYRDVAFEYPPLAAPLLALPAVAGTAYEDYRIGFAVLAFLLALAAAALTAALARRTGGDARTAAVAVAAVLGLTCGALMRTRFDLAPVALVLLALVLLLSARPRLAFAALGAGAAVKLFPLAVAPVAFAWLWGRGERRAAWDGAIVLAIVLAVTAASGLALSPGGFADSFRYHLDRPPQVESVPALALLALDWLGLGSAGSLNAFRSDGLEHPAGDALAGAFLGLMAAAVVTLAVLARARAAGDDGRALVLAALGALLAFAALGKVLSPQFLIWVVPLCALAVAWRMPVLAIVTAFACALTLAEFPGLYRELVAREALPVAIVAVRDALMLAALALVLATLSEGRREPARAPGRSP